MEVDEKGTPIGTLQGSKVQYISEVSEVGDKLLLGSPYNNYLGLIKQSEIALLRKSLKDSNKQKNLKDEL